MCGCCDASAGVLAAQRPYDVASIEHLDILGLNGCDSADGPDELHMVGLDRVLQHLHVRLFGGAISLLVIAACAGRDHVVPSVVAAPADGQQVIPREELAVAEVAAMAATVLTGIAIAGEEERIGDVAPEAAWYVNVLDETDDDG